MAEVLATFSALSSFLQVVDFTAKVGKHAHKLITSDQNAEEDNLRTEVLARDLHSLTTGLSPTTSSDGQGSSPHAATLSRLSQMCRDEVDGLLIELQKLKIPSSSQGLTRIRDGTKKAISTIWSRQNIEKRRLHLQELNGQLITALLQSFLPKLDEQATEALTLLRRSGNDYHRHDLEVASDLDGLEYVAHKVRVLNSSILQDLKLVEVSAREDSIVPAYPETYQWALKEKSLGLSSWLRYGSGIFWISGKAGAGKSTLMKFLCSCKEARQLLVDWSGSRPLVFANFYFWYTGTDMQKSAEGLSRSLLHQILTEQIDLAPIAFPDHYSDVVRGNDDFRIRPNYHELKNALRRISQHKSETKDRRNFCFFIDGLDEFHGNQLELIGLLRDLARNHRVKLCVASRPWNVFRNAFDGKTPSLRLEDLSRPDMLRYVRNEIETASSQLESQEAEQNAGVAELVDEIVSRAEGVFLWVVLVVKSVLLGLAEGDHISFLRHRVQTFPSDLDEFFENTLARVDPIYKSHSSQALKLAYELEKEGGLAKDLSSWVDFWLIKQNPQGFEAPKYLYVLDPLDISIEKAEKMLLETQIHLSATCKDLLWVTSARPVVITRQVQFLHRTVYDFLKHEHIQAMLDAQIHAQFKDLRIFHLLNLTRWKYVVALAPDAMGVDDSSDASDEIRHNHLRNTSDMSIVRAHPDLNRNYAHQFEMMLLQSLSLSRKPPCLYNRPDALAVLVAFGCSAYLRKVMQASVDDMFLQPELTQVLVAALGGHGFNSFSLEDADLDLIASLILWNGNLSFNAAPSPPPDNLGQRMVCSNSVWAIFLRQCTSMLRPLYAHDKPRQEDLRRRCWRIAKMFLEQGASTEEVFCNNPKLFDSEAHTDCNQTAAAFLREYIPWDWIEESGIDGYFPHVLGTLRYRLGNPG